MIQNTSVATASWRGHDDITFVFFVTHEDPSMLLATNLLGTDSISCFGQTTECKSMTRTTSVALLRLYFPPNALSIRLCWAISCWQTVLRKQHCGTLVLEFQMGRRWEIHLFHWSNTIYKILLWKLVTLSVREGKPKTQWNNMLLLQECHEHPKRKITRVLPMRCGRTGTLTCLC